MNKKYFMIIILVLSVVLLVLGCVSELKDSSEKNAESMVNENVENVQGDSKNNEEDKEMGLFFDEGGLPDIVMNINGQEITRDQFILEYEQTKTLYDSIGMDIESVEVQRIMQEALISGTIEIIILAQEADKLGIIVSDIDVQEKVKQSISQYPDEKGFYDMLSRLNTTLEDFEIKTKRQLKIAKLLEQIQKQFFKENDFLNFTEEQKREMYEQFKLKVGEMRDYEDVKDQIDDILEKSKVQIIIEDYIQNLIEDSEIELYLNKRTDT